MRQTITVLFIFVFFLFIIAYFPADFSNRLQPERFVAEDVLVFSKQYNFIDRIQEFKTTPLAEAFLGIDYTMLSETLGMVKIDTASVKKWQEELDAVIEHPLMSEVFGKEFSIALFPKLNEGGFWPETDLLSHCLIIARPHHHARIIELFSDLIDHSYGVTDAKFGGYVIKRIPVEDFGIISFARVKDLILLSFDERILRKSLDVYDTDSSLVSNSHEYDQMSSSLVDCSSVTYINVGTVIQSLDDTFSETKHRQINDTLRQSLSKFEGYESLIIGNWNRQDALEQKAILTYNPAELQKEYRELFNVRPTRTDTHAWINGDTIWYYWTNILRPQALLDMYHSNIVQPANLENKSLINDISSITGVPVKELLSLVENDVVVALKDSSHDHFIPIPQLLVAIKTNNSEKLLQVIQTLIRHYNIPLTKQSIEGMTHYLWGGVIPAGDLQPGFSVTPDYIVLSSNRQQIKEFIRKGQGIQTLNLKPAFKAVDIGLTERNNSINFIDFTQLTSLFKEMISWVGTMIAIQDRETAKRSKRLIDEIINPVLDGMAMYSTIGIRSYTDTDRLIIESKIVKQ